MVRGPLVKGPFCHGVQHVFSRAVQNARVRVSPPALKLNPQALAAVQKRLNEPQASFKPLQGENVDVLPLDAALIGQRFEEGGALRARFPQSAGATAAAAAVGSVLGGAMGALLTSALAGFSANPWTVAGTLGGAAVGGWLFSRPGGEELVEVEAPQSLEQLAGVLKDLPGVRHREFGLAAFIDDQGRDRYFVSRGGMMAVATPGSMKDSNGAKLVNVGQVAHTHPVFTFPGASSGDLYEVRRSAWSGQHEAILVQANGDWSVYDGQGSRPPSDSLAASPISALFR